MQVLLQLNALISHAHGCGPLVLRDLSLENVVFASLGPQRGWTLLELTSAVKAGRFSPNLAARSAPPEVRRSCLLYTSPSPRD